MKKGKAEIIVLLIICCTGGLLIGFNASHLSQGLNVVLFVLGVILLSGANTILGLLNTIWKRK